MNKDLYEMIFKRKSFHLFRNIGNEHLTEDKILRYIFRGDTIYNVIIPDDGEVINVDEKKYL